MITPAGEQIAVDRLRVEYGVLAVDVPAGRSRVSLRLGWQVSAVSALILLLVLLADWLKRRRLALGLV